MNEADKGEAAQGGAEADSFVEESGDSGRRRHRKRKRRQQAKKGVPVIVFPILVVIAGLTLLCLIIYMLSACRFNLDRLNYR